MPQECKLNSNFVIQFDKNIAFGTGQIGFLIWMIIQVRFS